jgi:hypothetical protein
MKIGLSESSVDGFHRLEFSSLLSLVNFHASGVGELVVGFKRSETMSKEVSIMAAHQETSRADAITKFGKRQLTSLEEEYFSELLAQVKKLDSYRGRSIISRCTTGM